jgi:hypothetical protein
MLKLPIRLANSPARSVSRRGVANPPPHRDAYTPFTDPASPENDKAPPLVPDPALKECLDCSGTPEPPASGERERARRSPPHTCV